MTIPPLTVRPVVHTDYLAVWLGIFGALGAVALTADPMWTELQLDRGRVTLTALNRGAAEGDVSLGFETPGLGIYAASILPPDGMVVEKFVTEDYESLRVVGRDGTEFLIDERLAGPPLPEQAATAIRAVWVTSDVSRTAAELESLGLRRRLTQVNGRTIDLRAAEGDVLVHTSDGGPIGGRRRRRRGRHPRCSQGADGCGHRARCHRRDPRPHAPGAVARRWRPDVVDRRGGRGPRRRHPALTQAAATAGRRRAARSGTTGNRGDRRSAPGPRAPLVCASCEVRTALRERRTRARQPHRGGRCAGPGRCWRSARHRR
jgi:hypothetical protein